jgi:hypothetical protein
MVDRRRILKEQLDKAKSDWDSVFDLADRFVRAIDVLTTPREPPPPPPPSTRTHVDARVIRRPNGSLEVVLTDPDKPKR